jgi:ribulose-phosphate 3-epimerase
MTKATLIAPSILSADFAHLADEVAAVERGGADLLHVDVMDGHFVPNLTFGADLVAACRSRVEVPFEAHLMVERPDDVVHSYVEAGCEIVIVHAEATVHLHRTLSLVRDAGASPAVALNPSTPLAAVQHVLDLVDMVLVMTVNPGFGGQAYIATREPKIAALRSLLDSVGLDIDIEVDGGIGPATIGGAARAGANVLVAGTSLFKDPEGLEHAVADLRSRAEAAAS